VSQIETFFRRLHAIATNNIEYLQQEGFSAEQIRYLPASMFNIIENLRTPETILRNNPAGVVCNDSLEFILSDPQHQKDIETIKSLSNKMNYPPKFGPVNKVQIMVGKTDDDEDPEGVREGI
jgi:hypothetical protein